MAKSVEDQLADVQDAIGRVEGGAQEFWIKDRKLRRADLGALDKRAQRLEQKAARAARGGIGLQRIVPL